MASEGITLATAYVQLTSSAEGLGKEIIGKVGDAGDKAGKEGGEKAGKSFGQRFTSILTSGKAIAGGAIVGAVVASVKGLYSVGSVFDDVSDTIRVGTGATGEALEGLVDVAKNVGSTVPSQFDKIGPVVADLNTRLGLSGKTLETVASQYLQAGNILGQDVDINKTTAAFGAFGIKGAEVSDAMDQLFRVSQATGVGMNELATSAQTQGSVFKNLGFTFEDTISFMGSLDKAGVNSQAVMASMSKGLVTLAQDGEDPKQAFARVTDEIGKFIEKGDTAGALNMASKVFGTRGAAQFVGAVQSGTLAVDDLMAATGATSDTILGVADDTADLAESWQVFKNKALLAIQPIASKTFDLLSSGMKKLAGGFDPALKAVKQFYWSFLDFSTGSGSAVDRFLSGLSMSSAEADKFSESLADDKLMAFGRSIRSISDSLFKSAKPGFDALIKSVQPVLSILPQLLGALSPVHLIFKAIEPLLPQIASLIGTLAGSIASFVGGAIQGVTPLLQAIVGVIDRLMPIVSTLIASLLPPLNTLFQALAPLLDAVLAAILPIVDAISASLIPIIEALLPVVETVFNAIGPIITTVMDALGGLITFLTGVFSGDWSKAWDGIKQIFSGIWDGIKAVMQGAWDVLKAIWDVIAGVFQSVVLDPLKTAVGWLNDNVIQPIVDAFSTAWDGIKGVWNVVSGWFTENVITPLKTAFDWVNSHAIQPVVNAFKNAVTNIKAAWQGVVGFFKGIVNGVIGGFEWLVNSVIDAVNSVFNLIRENSGIASILPGGGAVAKALQEVSGGFPHVSFPRLEKGGPVVSARPYIVGERGPELFVPSISGRIVPNHELQAGPPAAAMAALDLSGLESRLDQMAEEYRRLPQRLVTTAQNAGVPLVLVGAR